MNRLADSLPVNDKPAFVAHVRGDSKIQSLEAHLRSVSQLAAELAPNSASPARRTDRLLHDLGKYSSAFKPISSPQLGY